MTDSTAAERTLHFCLEYITRDFKFPDATIKIVDPEKHLELALSKPQETTRFKTEPGEGYVVAQCDRHVTERLFLEAKSTGQISVKKAAVSEVHSELHNFILRTLRLLRWRTRSPGRPNPFRAWIGFTWSLDGIEWKAVADSMTLRIKQQENAPVLTPDSTEFVSKGIAGDLDEPLGHELLREAWSNLEANQRSAVVIAVAAAEVGFKQFAITFLPDTAWILENLQSPPLNKMLDLFPWDKVKLAINQLPIAVPDVTKAELRKAVTLRNEIVHGGGRALTVDTAEAVLHTVRDLLYFLDTMNDGLAGGKGWALPFVSEDARMHFAKKDANRAELRRAGG